MTDRRSQLLKYIIEGYAQTGQPIGSRYIVDETGLQLSTATIRNEMADLEKEGYIDQPHTSAGRIPTVEGIEYYLDHLVERIHLPDRECRRLKAIFETSGIRGVAKAAAEESKVAVIIAQGNHDYYYTGFSHLFAQPEFSNTFLVQAISRAVDRLDVVIPSFLSDMPGREPRIYLGHRNPLGKDCVAMVVSNDHNTLFGLLSTLHTNYQKNMSLLRVIANYL